MGSYAGPNISEDGLVLALDAGNGKSYSQNEHPNPLDIYGWYVDGRGNNTAGSSTISRDSIYSPVGNTPLKMEVTGNDPQLFSYNSAAWNIAPALNGERWIVSVYVKANVSTTGEILIFGANSSGAAYVDGGWLSLTGTTVNIGTEWTRVQHIHTMNNADVAFIHARLDGPNSGGAGQTVWWDGLQVERVPAGVSTPTPFNSFYTGANTIRDLIGSNNGTLTNRPTYNSSNGGSLSFDGVDDYISETSSLSDAFWQSNWTASFWVNFNTLSTTSGGAADRPLLHHGSNILRSGLHLTQRNNVLYFGLFSDDLGGTNTLSTGIWYNVVYTLNNSTYEKQIYLNGSLDNSHIGGGAYVGTGSNSRICGKLLNFGLWFDGFMSCCNFYSRVLTPQEIQQNFNATRGRFGI